MKIIGLFSWLFCSFFYSYQMLLRLVPSIIMDEIVLKFSISADQIGYVATFYYLGYTIFMIPIGIMIDKFSPRFVISLSLLICSLSNIGSIYAETIYQFYFSRFLIGISSIAGIIGSVRAINDFYRSKYSIMIGITIFTGIIGPVFAGTILKSLIMVYGSDTILLSLTYIGMIISSLIFLIYKSPSRKTSSNSEFIKYFLEIIKDKQIIVLSLIGGIMVGPIGGLADMWISKYLIHTKNINSVEAEFSMSLIFIGYGIGAPVIGYLSRKISNYSNLVVVIGLSQIFTLMFLFFVPNLSPNTIYLLCIWIGIFCAYQVVLLSISSTLVRSEFVSIAASIVNSFCMLFASIYHFSIGYILKNFFYSKSKIIIIYDSTAYHFAFSSIILGLLIGVVGFKFVKFNKKINIENNQ